MIKNIDRIITEKTLVSLTIPSGWTIITNNLLDINLKELSSDELEIVVKTYYDYEVFGAEFSRSNRSLKHNFYIYVHCSPISKNYLEGFSYDLSYFLVSKNKKVPEFSDNIVFYNLESLVCLLNRILIKVHYDIDEIVKDKALRLDE